MAGNFEAIAASLAANQIPTFPCDPATKRPLTQNGFKDASFDQETIRHWGKIHPNAMIGRPTGDGYFVLDVDLPDGPSSLEALEAVHGKLPPTTTTRTPSGGLHMIFKSAIDVKNSVSKIGVNLDIRGKGGYVVVAGSVNDSSKAYVSINDLPVADAPGWLVELANGAKADDVKNHTPTPPHGSLTSYGKKALENEAKKVETALQGTRNAVLNEASFSLGQLVAGGEIPLSLAEAALKCSATSTGLPDGEIEKTTRSGLAAGMAEPRRAPVKSPTHYTAEDLAPYVPKPGDENLLDSPKAVNIRPEPLPNELLPVAKFDYALLPEAFRAWVQDIAERMQCPPDFVAVSAMIALATVVGRKVGIRPQDKTDWTVVANLWGLVVGRPGVMKSPSVDAGKAPLQRLVAKARTEHQKAMAEFSQFNQVEQIRAGVQKKEASKKLSEDPDADVSDLFKVKPEISKPVERRYETMDPTPAALCELLRSNPNGLLVFRDEMVSLLKNLDRPDNAEGRGLYLTGWNGDSPFVVDRIGRGFNLDVEAICLSLLGGTQPGKLAEYISQAITGGISDDGLIQRFGMMVWPDDSKQWENVDRWPDREAKNRAFAVFDAVDQLDLGAIGAESDLDMDGKAEGIPYLRFAVDAQRAFLEWRNDLENIKLRGDDHPAIISHLAKYRKLVPALALLCHLADGGIGPVALAPSLQALAWAEYLETHARRAYGAVSQPELRTAKAIKRRIKNGDLPETFAARDVYRPGWSQLTDREQVGAGLRLLVEYGHLFPEESSAATGRGGRPATVYHVNKGGSQ